MTKKPEFYSSKGIKMKSKEEMYFEWWLRELEDAGIAVFYEYELLSFLLSKKERYLKEMKMKTKTKMVERVLLGSHSYTPDFRIVWNSKNKFLHQEAFNKGMHLNEGCYYTYVDVKGGLRQEQERHSFSFESEVDDADL